MTSLMLHSIGQRFSFELSRVRLILLSGDSSRKLCFHSRQGLRDLFVMQGAGIGGGSLVYANTLLEPPNRAFESEAWVGAGDDTKPQI